MHPVQRALEYSGCGQHGWQFVPVRTTGCLVALVSEATINNNNDPTWHLVIPKLITFASSNVNLK